MQQTLLVFSDDWGRHPSSCQHLIRHLLPRYRVGWVNTIGMRPPALNWSTIQRCGEKLRAWTRPSDTTRESPPNLEVLCPLMWPWFRRPIDRSLNRLLLSRSLNRWLARRAGPVTAITTIPVVADLIGNLTVDRWVYYCVDDFAQWPGLDQQAMQIMESDLIPRVDRVLAVSESLRDRLAVERADDIELLPHGVDLDHWGSGATRRGSNLLGPNGPHVVFWGLLDRRMDLEFLSALGDTMKSGTITLVGPESDVDPSLNSIRRVRRVPAVPYEQLPDVAQAADVLIMPYTDSPVTQAMQPLKMLEYLATGRPVVVRDLPSTRSWGDCLDQAANAEQFANMVVERICGELPQSQAIARRRLEFESWASKAEAFQRFALA